MGQLRNLNSAGVLAEGDPVNATIYGTLFFSTGTFVIPPQPRGPGRLPASPLRRPARCLVMTSRVPVFASVDIAQIPRAVTYQFISTAIPKPGHGFASWKWPCLGRCGGGVRLPAVIAPEDEGFPVASETYGSAFCAANSLLPDEPRTGYLLSMGT